MKALTKDQAKQCRNLVVSYMSYYEALNAKRYDGIKCWGMLLEADQKTTGIEMVPVEEIKAQIELHKPD